MLHIARMGIVLLIFWIASSALAQPSAMTDSTDVQVGEPDVPVVSDSMASGQFNIINIATIRGWKFMQGDDLSWASASLDDSDWHNIGVLIPFPDSLWSDVGWFRLAFVADSSLAKRFRLLTVRSDGAAEVYLNGELLQKLGVPSSIAREERVGAEFDDFLPPLNLVPGQRYVLAIRASYHDHAFYQRWSPVKQPAFQISASILDYSFLKSQRADNLLYLGLFTFFAASMLTVMILHLAMFLRFRAEKGNLWIFLIAVSLFVPQLASIMGEFPQVIGARLQYLLNDIFRLGFFVAFTIIPICIARVLDVPFNRKLYVLPLLIPVLEVCRYVLKESAVWFVVAVIVVATVVIVVQSVILFIRAKRMQRKDFGIVTLSMVSPLIVLTIWFTASAITGGMGTLGTFLFLALLFLPMPIGLSVYQMRRFFAAHGNLEGEVKTRTLELESAMERLRANMEELTAAQEQLVQQEKLASLGQLTAGIAHEIKNPLNFVNNFSQVSLEMVDEAIEEVVKEERRKKEEVGEDEVGEDEGGGDLGLILDILTDVRQNLAKIHEHGSRADGIVKSMLMHSRGGSGKREPADLNQVVKEYVNLAFHGMRAGKDAFTVDVVEEYDPTVGQVPIVTEDFSRVILNICNNAFDAMRGPGGGTACLHIRTNRNGNRVSVEIEDNGPGIPDDIKDKILQPFFTTKRGTQGTGLGLSITHDIVKAHGGSIDIESQPGKTKFIITLPTV